MRRLLSAGLLAMSIALATPSFAQKSILVSSTTSTEQSGLFGFILPIYKSKSGVEVKVVAVGTGQALDIGRRGDADVVFVHDKVGEMKFLEEGYSTKRYDVMYNDFVLIGPKSDPAKIAGGKDIKVALQKIGNAKTTFVSRGDKSGTHAAELRYWKDAGIDPNKDMSWYKDTGSGMGPALNTASAMNAYILADRGTWLSFKNRGDLEILVEGDPKLFNQYGVMLVNPEKFPQVKAKEGQAFIDWLISRDGQEVIALYKIDGKQLFFPNAKK
ncbi:tungstate transport system substrate-binding protein [Polynucleobacter meluiroseus]|uniref:Tungstate transport system substrate-binding protein n=1 Tax=Polynucleobacter meluiroseus TaxID=1938814 RepID=A0A240E1H0_9BURK|nr:substrate-binding domain-containing protein [Polynucleobacter meluiroseus]SNX29288.1 tungstate transport system substrate-binding protein [Polynucleobacter meluiroseus]